MITQQLEVSILAAPLAGMDRRALSQAWYSALRLTPKAQQITPVRRRAHREAGIDVQRRSIDRSDTAACTNAATRIAPVGVARRVTLGFDEEASLLPRRAPRSTLAERIEHAFADVGSRPKRATFSMGPGHARVHVILQTTGARTTLLALCRPQLRGVVGRALAQARLALAQRGIGVELRAVGERACS
jgi:hypothetical protein